MFKWNKNRFQGNMRKYFFGWPKGWTFILKPSECKLCISRQLYCLGKDIKCFETASDMTPSHMLFTEDLQVPKVFSDHK